MAVDNLLQLDKVTDRQTEKHLQSNSWPKQHSANINVNHLYPGQTQSKWQLQMTNTLPNTVYKLDASAGRPAATTRHT